MACENILWNFRNSYGVLFVLPCEQIKNIIADSTFFRKPGSAMIELKKSNNSDDAVFFSGIGK